MEKYSSVSAICSKDAFISLRSPVCYSSKSKGFIANEFDSNNEQKPYSITQNQGNEMFAIITYQIKYLKDEWYSSVSGSNLFKKNQDIEIN